MIGKSPLSLCGDVIVKRIGCISLLHHARSMAVADYPIQVDLTKSYGLPSGAMRSQQGIMQK